MWQRLRLALVCALLAAVTGVAIQAILLLHAATEATRALMGTVVGEVQATQTALVGQVAAARADLTGQVAAARGDLLARTERQVAALRIDVMAQVAQIRTTADRRVGDSLRRVDTALGGIEEIRGDLEPVLANAAALAEHADKMVVDLHPQVLGLVAASKVTMGQTAETMRDIQRATPGFIATWQQIGAHVDLMADAGAKSMQATQHTMENFAAASKPLPTWARIALGVGPPVAQMGAAAAATGAAIGWFK